MSILRYGCIIWTLTKRMEKRHDGNYTILGAISKKSRRQRPTNSSCTVTYTTPITKTIQVRRTRHLWHCWRSRDELISDLLLWTPSHGRAKTGPTYNSSVLMQNIALKTDQTGSGISMLMAWDDDDDDLIIFLNMCGIVLCSGYSVLIVAFIKF